MTIYNYADHVDAYPELTVAQRQRLGCEPGGTPLDDDGIIGRRTRSGIYLAPRAEHRLVDNMLRLSLLNAREEGGNNKGRWPAWLMGQQQLLGLTPEDIAQMSEGAIARWSGVQQGPFCAGTVTTAIALSYGPDQPASLSAKVLTQRWSRKPGQVIALADAQPGDLICWNRDGGGHIGVVAGRHDGVLLTVEGNGSRKNGAVGVYGYGLRDGAQRGTQYVILLARRQDLNPPEV
jgi:hypothetical protein